MRYVVLVALCLAACGGQSVPEPEEAPLNRAPIEEVLERHTPRLLAIDGIQGTYIGQNDAGAPCLVILATVPAEELRGSVEEEIEGWPVRIESGDEIRPMN